MKTVEEILKDWPKYYERKIREGVVKLIESVQSDAQRDIDQVKKENETLKAGFSAADDQIHMLIIDLTKVKVELYSYRSALKIISELKDYDINCALCEEHIEIAHEVLNEFNKKEKA